MQLLSDTSQIRFQGITVRQTVAPCKYLFLFIHASSIQLAQIKVVVFLVVFFDFWDVLFVQTLQSI